VTFLKSFDSVYESALFPRPAFQRPSLRQQQKVSLSVASSTIGLADIYIKDSWGANLGARLVGTGSDFMDTVTLPSTGPYTVSVNPRTAYTGGLTLTLNNTNDVTGTSGQQVTVHITGSTMGNVAVSLVRPGGATMTTSNSFGASSFNLATQTLDATGTFTIRIDPPGTSTGTMNVTVTSP
jgi:hypothetical protein